MLSRQFFLDIKNDDVVCETVLGLKREVYRELYRNFESNKAGERKTVLTGEDKFIAALLIKKFKFTVVEFNSLLIRDSSKKTAADFINPVTKRLEQSILLLDDAKQEIVGHAMGEIRRPALISSHINDLDILINISTKMAKGLDVSLTKYDEEAKISYANKSVTEKKNNGQDSFMQMVSCMVYDLEDFNSVNQYTIWYISIVMHLFIHNSSHAPKSGYGKAQSREEATLNTYYRSQVHAHLLFYRMLTAANLKQQCLMARNHDLEKIMVSENNIKLTENKFLHMIEKYNPLGYMKNDQAEKTNYFSTMVAHSGLRKSNYNQYLVALGEFLNINTNQFSDFIEKLADDKSIQLSFTNKVGLYTSDAIKKKLPELLASFENLECYDEISHHLLEEMTLFREQRILSLRERYEKEKMVFLKVRKKHNTTCLFVDFYPGKVIPKNANYKDGVTNIIIGFFGGLLNYHCARRGMYYHTERRQSFGFLRSSITNAGNMRMRLSLGLEPPEFEEVIFEALKDMNYTLSKFDFLNKEDASLKNGFEICEKSKGKENTDATGNKFRKEMRSESHLVDVLNYAQYSLSEANGNLDNSFKKYINAIVDGTYHDAILKGIDPVGGIAFCDNPVNNVSLKLLNNIYIHTIENVKNLDLNDFHSKYTYTYYRTLMKLQHCCRKANAILTNYDHLSASKFFSKSILLAEEMLEYLTVLDGLKFIHKRMNGNESHADDKLSKLETTYTSSALEIDNKHKMYSYFNDCGQQAITASLFVMSMQIFQRNKKNDLTKKVYLDKSCYFEVPKFFDKELKISTTNSSLNAEIIVTDIMRIGKLMNSESSCDSASAVIIDITHRPSLNNDQLKRFVNQLLEKGKWVLLVSSMLKHEQLGIDKHQAGKTIVIAPKGKELDKNIQDEFSKISETALHPVIGSYFRMMNKITQDKLPLNQKPILLSRDAARGRGANDITRHKQL